MNGKGAVVIQSQEGAAFSRSLAGPDRRARGRAQDEIPIALEDQSSRGPAVRTRGPKRFVVRHAPEHHIPVSLQIEAILGIG
jgi:hypothetical protein